MVVGIVGQGNFGRFAAGLLAADEELRVQAYDTKNNSETVVGVQMVGLTEIAQADIIILCIPLSAYDDLLPKLQPLLRQETLVIDICSVKLEAERLLRKHVPNHKNVLITHPMFGPQSAASGTQGHILVVTGSVGQEAQAAVDYCQTKLGLKILRMTSEEHDKAMADVHALTFFLARGLSHVNLVESSFQAPSFQLLLDLVAFDKAHSEDLFRTIEVGNPFAKDTRRGLIQALEDIDDELRKEEL